MEGNNTIIGCGDSEAEVKTAEKLNGPDAAETASEDAFTKKAVNCAEREKYISRGKFFCVIIRLLLLMCIPYILESVFPGLMSFVPLHPFEFGIKTFIVYVPFTAVVMKIIMSTYEYMLVRKSGNTLFDEFFGDFHSLEEALFEKHGYGIEKSETGDDYFGFGETDMITLSPGSDGRFGYFKITYRHFHRTGIRVFFLNRHSGYNRTKRLLRKQGFEPVQNQGRVLLYRKDGISVRTVFDEFCRRPVSIEVFDDSSESRACEVKNRKFGEILKSYRTDFEELSKLRRAATVMMCISILIALLFELVL